MNAASHLVKLLALKTAPVGVTFRDKPPAGVPRAAAGAPSSCTYWKRAADGQTFYTVASDHYDCPIGGYTHGVDLPAQQMQELQGVIGTMVQLGYLRSEEVPGLPRRQAKFGVAVYAPMTSPSPPAPVPQGASGEVPELPDVVLLHGNAKQMMLLEEAAQAAGVGAGGAMMGRPTCAALPAAMASQRGVASLGCIGNRVYTDLADDELYYALPGKHLDAVVAQLDRITQANRELEKYHRARRSNLKEKTHAT